jgi:hypothetical protein
MKLPGSLQQPIPEIVESTKPREHAVNVDQIAEAVTEIAVSKEMRPAVQHHVFGRKHLHAPVSKYRHGRLQQPFRVEWDRVRAG